MQTDFIPVLLGSDVNVYGMARAFHQAYGINSLAIGKGTLPPTANSSIVTINIVEPELENDEVFVKTFHPVDLKEARRLYRRASEQGRLIRTQENALPLLKIGCEVA